MVETYALPTSCKAQCGKSINYFDLFTLNGFKAFSVVQL